MNISFETEDVAIYVTKLVILAFRDIICRYLRSVVYTNKPYENMYYCAKKCNFFFILPFTCFYATDPPAVFHIAGPLLFY